MKSICAAAPKDDRDAVVVPEANRTGKETDLMNSFYLSVTPELATERKRLNEIDKLIKIRATKSPWDDNPGQSQDTASCY